MKLVMVSNITTLTRNMFGLWLLVMPFREYGRAVMMSHCSDQTWTKFSDRLFLVSRWRIVKSNKSFVHYLFKNCGMIVIQLYLSSLLLALTSNFHLAKPHIFRNVGDWKRHKLKTSCWLRSRFHMAMPSWFWFLFMFAKTHPRQTSRNYRDWDCLGTSGQYPRWQQPLLEHTSRCSARTFLIQMIYSQKMLGWKKKSLSDDSSLVIV